MNRIRKLRKESGMSQTELAKQLGVVQSTLSYWEQGKYDIDNSSLITLANYFDVSVDYLLGNAQKKNSQSRTENENSENAINYRQEVMRLIDKADDEKLQKVVKILEILEDDRL